MKAELSSWLERHQDKTTCGREKPPETNTSPPSPKTMAYRLDIRREGRL